MGSGPADGKVRANDVRLVRWTPLLFLGGLLAFLLLAAAASALPDLRVSDGDVSLGVRSPTQGTDVTVSAVVHNDGDAAATNFTVTFYLDTTGSPIASVAVTTLAAGALKTVNATWGVGSTSAASHDLIARADSGSVVSESNELNNQGTKTFTVNQPPTAAASVNATSQRTLDLFSFSAAGSTDPDGTIQTYLWLFDDATSATGAAVNHSYADGSPSPGKTYRVTLIVTDDDGGTASAQVTVRVINRAPAASASNVAGPTKTALVFDASGSTDLDGRIVNTTWAFSDGRTIYGLTILRSFDDNGLYAATVTIRDDDGATDAIGIQANISNQPPVAVITMPPAPFQVGQSVLFEGSGSFDVDGGIANFTWVFPLGDTRYGRNTTASFSANGTYNVTLVLVDDDGAIGQTTAVAIVGNDTLGPRPPSPPVASIHVSSSVVDTATPVTFDGSNSSDDTGIVSYLWDFGDGGFGSGPVLVHAYGNDGNYVVTLNVTDTDGNSSTASATIRVRDRPPIPVISYSPSSVLTQELITFSGEGSVDPDGFILYYRFDYGDGSTLYGLSTAYAYGRPGTYNVTLTVTDNDGSEARAWVLVAIGNRQPVAVLAPGFSVPSYEERIFDGSLSYDPDGLVVTYEWNFGDGTTGSGRSVKHAFAPPQGVKVVTLTVRDDFGAASSATMNVTVTNLGPLAAIQAPSSAYTRTDVIFTAIASDRDGSVASYAWDFGDGGTAATATAAHPYQSRGSYTVSLTVKDNLNAPTTVTFTIRILNQLPRALIAAPATPPTVQTLESVHFSAEGSADTETPAGSLAFFWLFGDGTVAQGVQVDHTYGRSGIYTVILAVSDTDGGAASQTLIVTVANQRPIAGATASATVVQTLEPVTFYPNGTHDPEGLITAYEWDFGDGSTSTERTPTHTYRSSNPAGTLYPVRLTVTDDEGVQSSVLIDITVRNRAPTAVILHGIPIYATISAIFRGNGSTDLDGVIVNWTWSFGEGSDASYGIEVGHAYATPGNYTLTLTVVDSRGATHQVTETLVVIDRPRFDPGRGTGPGTTPTPTPGFDAVAALVSVAAVGALALAARRRRAD